MPEQRPSSKPTFENVLGTRVLGIMAALLVFAGLVFLAILVVPTLSDEVRCAAMFVLSIALAVGGTVTTMRKKSPFSLALLGCGMGSVFASLLITYVYFGFLTEAPTMALMLAWLALCMLLAKRNQSATLVVVAQIGMAISVCFAYVRGMEVGQLPLVLAYQIAACVIVVFGCLKSLERGRLAGAFACMFVSLIVSTIVSSAYAFDRHLMEATVFIAAMVTQLVTLSALALMVTLLSGKDADNQSTNALNTISYVCAEVLWFASLGINVTCGALLATYAMSLTASTQTAAFATLGFIALHWATTIVLNKVGRLPRRHALLSVYLCAAASTLTLVWRLYATPRQEVISLVVLVAAAVWLTGKILSDARIQASSVAFLGFDALLMAQGGYEALNAGLHAPVAVLYVLALDALLFGWWRTLPAEKRTSLLDVTLLAGVIATEISLFCAWASAPMPNDLSRAVAFACCLALSALLVLAEPRERLQIGASAANVLFVNELIVVLLSCLVVVGRGPASYARVSPVGSVLAIGVCLIALCIMVFWLIRMATHARVAQPWEQVLAGIAFTVWAMSTTQGMLPAGGDAPVTVVGLLSAFACIVLGFMRRLDAIRVYGLAAALLSVSKIVLFDVRGQDPVGRVIAFIVGGLICFAISAVYTIAVRRLETPRE